MDPHQKRSFKRLLFLMTPIASAALLAAALIAFIPGLPTAAVAGPGLPLLLPLGETGALTQSVEYLPLVMESYSAPTVFGVEMSSISQGNRVDLVRQAGSYWVRKNGLLWSSVQPVLGGGYQWANVSGLEAQLKTAAVNGLHTILVVRSTPSWAQKLPGVSCGPVKRQHFDEFGAFLAAAVARYSAAPYYVHHYEIWNEPDVDPALVDPNDLFGCWGDDGDTYYGGSYYGDMLQVVYPMIKAADSNARVLVGGLLLDCDPRNPPPGKDCKPSKFLEGILVSGAKNAFDGVSFHAYDYYNWVYDTFGNPNWNSGRLYNEVNGVHKPVLITKVDFLNEVLDAYNANGKFLINTEVGLLCGASDDPPGQPGCDALDTSPYEIMKTAYMAQAHAAAIAEGLLGNVWYSMTGWRNSGLIYTNLAPRPAYFALDFSQDMLWNASYLGKVTGYSKVKGYKFSPYGGNDIWIMWATDGGTQVVTLPNTPLNIWDSLGNPVTITGATVTLDVEPYYIEMP